MERRRNTRNYRLALLTFFAILPTALAQQAPPSAPGSITLDEILQRLEANLHRYDTQVPNFFCSEHVVSLMTYGKSRQSTATDSIFRLERSSTPGRPSTLNESREIKTINGSPTESKDISGPSILSGVFSGGLDTVSLSQKACMTYALQPVSPERPINPDKPYIVQFATLPSSQRPSNCVLKEDGVGRVFIDPTTMQVTRMELTAPRHIILPATVGTWRISIDYAPVLFSGQTFWMPAAITSRATPNNPEDPAVWSFNAHYANYHKLEVTSHIVPSP
jgi:hypothetical protein